MKPLTLLLCLLLPSLLHASGKDYRGHVGSVLLETLDTLEDVRGKVHFNLISQP